MKRLLEKLPLLGAMFLILPLLIGEAAAADGAESSVATEVAEMNDMGDVNDPLEPFNRVMFEFNEALQVMFLRPAATLYKGFLPPPGQEMVSNFLDNLSSTVVLANDLLQGEVEFTDDDRDIAYLEPGHQQYLWRRRPVLPRRGNGRPRS